MQLGDLTALMKTLDVPAEAESRRPPRDNVRAIQQWVAAALGGEDFLLDCLELELRSMPDRVPRADMEPFLVEAETGVRFAFAYWPPGRAAGAHEHNDWTVTAVCHNRLDVETYDFAVARAERTLKIRKVHPAEAGRAGHIYDPCIHNPYNQTSRWSMSIHLIAPHDGPRLEQEVGPIAGLGCKPVPGDEPDDPLAPLLRERRRQRIYRVHAELIAGYRSPRAFQVLERIRARGDLETRRVLAIQLATVDASTGARWMREDAMSEVGPDSTVARVWSAIPLSVEQTGRQARLISRCNDRSRVVLGLDSWAADTLDFLAQAQEFRIRDLPGRLGVQDAVALTRALVDLGLFVVLPDQRTAMAAQGA